MATHPFAIKLEEAIEKAKRLRDKLREAKKSTDDDQDEPRDTVNTRIFGHVNLGLIGLGGQALVEPGEATKLYVTEPSPAMARLLQKLANAERDCSRMRATAPIPAQWFTLANGKKSWFAGGPGKPDGSIPCPGVTAIQKQIFALTRRGGGFITRRTR